jgi:hypothetical protein
MGHLQGLDASIKPAGRLLQPTVSSRIKANGAEGYQIPEKQLTPRQRQQQKATAVTTRSNAHTTKQQQQQEGQAQAGLTLKGTSVKPQLQQKQPKVSLAPSRPVPQEGPLHSSAAGRAPGTTTAATAAAAAADSSAAGGFEGAAALYSSGAGQVSLSQTLKQSSIQAAKLKIGAAVGLHVAEVSMIGRTINSTAQFVHNVYVM